MILCDTTLRAMLPEIILTHRDESLVNPASIDIRIGGTIIIENPEWIGNPFDNPPSEGWLTIELGVSGNSSYV